jgi:nicotinamide mononucleotide (NMN) deamidase PncC
VAGPEPLDGEPPGVVWLALDAADRAYAYRRVWSGEREQVRRWTEQAALDLLRRYLDGSSLPGSDPDPS